MMEKPFLSFKIHSFLGGWGYYFEVMFENLGKTENQIFPSLETGYSNKN